MRIIAGSALALLITGCASATAQPQTRQPVDPQIDEALVLAIDAYQQCVVREARRLEPSGEPANVIVGAAKTSCIAARQRAMEVAALRTIVNNRLSAADAVSVADRYFARVDQEASDTAILEVTNMRASRAD